MIKKLLLLAVLVISALTSSAQDPGQLTPLPLNPEVKHGTLANGLNYYILHNEEPKERVNFYIAQKVGSSLETSEQLGLAHFLEHMAFNGTKHYPGKSMLEYLQNKGIRFGSDINAYTSFDETVYRIDNVPSTDKALVDSVLLVLYDWSGSILLEEDEINAERGVIEEEWRTRNSAQIRMLTEILPKVYSEYQYQQMPIGKMEVVRNFPPQAIRDYYHKWYRPDQQGIVIVGDIDADAMEAKVKELFSTIPMPENAAERTYPNVSDNESPIFAYYKDKETQFPMIMVSFKSEKLPFEARNTLQAFAQNFVLEELLSAMINNRLEEYAKKPECKYAAAQVNFEDFMVSKTKAAFQITIIAKDDVMGAYNDALAVVAQACKTGFMQSELVRARDQYIANYEKLFNERKNTKNSTLGDELCRHFIDNTPTPGIETEKQIAEMLANNVPVAAYNEFASQILTKNNQVIVLSEPDKEGMAVITEQDMVNGLNSAIDAQYEAYVDEVITDPLIADLAAPGKIVSEKAGEFGTTVMNLSNGVKVIVKPTDFKSDEIIMTAFADGGKQAYAADDAPNVLLAEDAFEVSKNGTFDSNKLQKYLAGKNVNLSYQIGNVTTSLNGKSNVKDLPTLLELVYSAFTQLNPDQEMYNTEMARTKSILANADKNPQTVFSRHMNAALYANNPMYQVPSVEMIDAADYMKELEIVKKSLSNAADYTFIFTGNVNIDSLKPNLEKYIANLPSTGSKDKVAKLTDINIAKGQVNDTFKQKMQNPLTMVVDVVSGNNVPYNIENAVKVEMVGDVLAMIYTNTLREEEGGTYSPYAGSQLNPNTGTWILQYVFETNDKMQDKLLKRANDEMLKLLNEGAKAEDFNRAKEAMLKQYDIQVRTNAYWDNNLYQLERGHDVITNHKAAIENLNLADFNKFMKSLYNGKNNILVMMQGVAEDAK